MLKKWMQEKLSLLISFICQCAKSELSKQDATKKYKSRIEERREGNIIYRKTAISVSDLYKLQSKGKDTSIGMSEIEMPKNISVSEWSEANEKLREESRPGIEAAIKRAYP